jgi:hypothetical protein
MEEFKIEKQDAEILHDFLRDNVQRNFDTPSDQHAVFTKLVDTKKWFEMYSFLISAYKKTLPDWILWKDVKDEHYYAWLFYNPERFCKLAADYLKEESK